MPLFGPFRFKISNDHCKPQAQDNILLLLSVNTTHVTVSNGYGIHNKIYFTWFENDHQIMITCLMGYFVTSIFFEFEKYQIMDIDNFVFILIFVKCVFEWTKTRNDTCMLSWNVLCLEKGIKFVTAFLAIFQHFWPYILIFTDFCFVFL